MPDIRRLARWETVTVALLVASILYGAVSADGFVSGQNLNSILSDVSEIALIALPMTLVIIAAEIDLSVASVLGLTSALLGYLWNHNWPMEAIVPVLLVVGGLLGAVNGFLVTRLGLPSLAVTIGTLRMQTSPTTIISSISVWRSVWIERSISCGRSYAVLIVTPGGRPDSSSASFAFASWIT